MDETELVVRARVLIESMPYLNLATSTADRPWSTPILAVHDHELNFYWSSWTKAVHSTNLESNSRASFTIYDSTRPRGTNNFRCLYVECTVSTVAEPGEAKKAFEMLYPGQPVVLDDFLSSGIKRFYKAIPTAAWLNCISERELTPTSIKMRTGIDLQALKVVFA